MYSQILHDILGTLCYLHKLRTLRKSLRRTERTISRLSASGISTAIPEALASYNNIIKSISEI